MIHEPDLLIIWSKLEKFIHTQKFYSLATHSEFLYILPSTPFPVLSFLSFLLIASFLISFDLFVYLFIYLSAALFAFPLFFAVPAPAPAFLPAPAPAEDPAPFLPPARSSRWPALAARVRSVFAVRPAEYFCLEERKKKKGG